MRLNWEETVLLALGWFFHHPNVMPFFRFQAAHQQNRCFMKGPRMWQEVLFLGCLASFLNLQSLTAAQGDADVPQASPSSRHTEKVKAVRKGRHNLVLIGDSITHCLGELDGKYAPFKAVWDQVFAPLNAINLGFNGYRTEQILWNLQQGQLDFEVSPKAFMLLIGTNNTDDRHFSSTHTAEEIFRGTQAIVDLILKRHPASRVLVMRIFPRGGDEQEGISPPIFHSSPESIQTCQQAGAMTRKLADGKRVFWMDMNDLFLNGRGQVDPALLWDLLHPSQEGALLWARTVEPTLKALIAGEPTEAIQVIRQNHGK